MVKYFILFVSFLPSTAPHQRKLNIQEQHENSHVASDAADALQRLALDQADEDKTEITDIPEDKINPLAIHGEDAMQQNGDEDGLPNPSAMPSPLPFHHFVYGPLTDKFFLSYSDHIYIPVEIELNHATIHNYRIKMRKKYPVLIPAKGRSIFGWVFEVVK
jgi:hypothetical protein